MSRRLRITDESYGGDRASFRGSQFFLRREREYSARIPRLQFSDDVIFRIGVSLSRSMLIGWKKKKIRRENPVLSPGEYFSPVESHCYRSRMRLACVPHTHTRDTRWIFSCSFELMKRADYQTLRHPYPRADTCANTPIVIMHPRISINDRIRPSSLLFLSSRQLLHPPRNNIPDEIFSLNLPR